VQSWVRLLRAFAALIALRATTNLFKPFGAGSAFVFFRVMLRSHAGLWLAAAFGVAMLAYAWGAWNLRRYALPMGIAYAAFVVLNIPLFAIINDIPTTPVARAVEFAFLLIGVGVTTGAAYLLHAHRHELL
jgi:hypothetical protein